MRKRVKLLILIIILLLIPTISWFTWYMMDKKELKVLIVDKTVLNKSVQEHISLSWILNHEKYVKENQDLYEYQKDYYGFFPDEKGGYEIHDFNQFHDYQIDSMANYYDMVYYTDLYGIYVAEWWDAYPQIAPKDYSKIPPNERSRLIYGRLTHKELELLRKMKERKKLIMTEFNIIASPTRNWVRKEFEDLFSMHWSRWTGRYFDVLDTNVNRDIPFWLKRNYVQQYGEWPFTKAGIAFVRNDDKVVILEYQTHLEYEVPVIHTPKVYAEKYDIPQEMKYPFWFDICSTEEPNIVISEYHLELNRAGDSILRMNNIPAVFPAIIKSEGDYPFYYFAGDFCDNPISIGSAKFAYSNYTSAITYPSTILERESFFWKFYRPLTTTIINDYYATLKKQ